MSQCKEIKSQSGFSLIELMVAIVIGMLIILAVLNLFLVSARTHKTTENLSRIQENARIAFELMAFDLRQAAGTPCGVLTKTTNVINPSASMPWFTTGLRGYEGGQSTGGTAASNRVEGTDALIYGLPSNTGVVVTKHTAGGSAQFKVNTNDHDLSDGDVAMVCDNNLAVVFQVTNVNDSNNTVVHNTGNSHSPGNCSVKYVAGASCADSALISGVVAPTACGLLEDGSYYEFCKNSTLVKYMSTLWYVGCNGRAACDALGGRSLYQVQFPNAAQEVVPDVQDMQIQYLARGATEYVDASAVTDWSTVIATRVSLTLVGPDSGVTTDSDQTQRLTRTVSHVVNLRNQ